ncbi:hypothetical protein H0H93_000105 [Arthromyces matolae]|nr:hypothetical protein H0H93_000105 [Arthromyces matolae]
MLFEEMISAGMEAIIIKVAGIGLTTKHLGKTLSEMHSTLMKLNQQYGAHICGEGGEYETLTLDCPLFKHRIVLTEVETVIHSDNAFATVAFLRIKNAHLEAKSPLPDFTLKIPDLLDEEFVALRDAVEVTMPCIRTERPILLPTEEPGIGAAGSRRIGPWVSVCDITRDIREPVVALTIEEEVTECFKALETRLSEFGLDVSNCVNINIFLSDITFFTQVNAVYSTFFGSSPPARACVAVDLPNHIRICLDCIAFVEEAPNDRQALHVQSLSYWAPANIGPYSQAITVRTEIFSQKNFPHNAYTGQRTYLHFGSDWARPGPTCPPRSAIVSYRERPSKSARFSGD